MIITNDFEVGAPLDRAWPVLLDIPRVARCLPGAQLESSDGAVHRGRMSAKIGPISATYAGTATVLEIDDDAHVVVMRLEAREHGVRGTRTPSSRCAWPAATTPPGSPSRPTSR